MATVAIQNLEKTVSSSGAAVDDVLDFTEDKEDYTYFIPGDKVKLPGLKERPGFQLIDAVAVEMPSYKERDEDVYGDFNSEICVTIYVEPAQLTADQEPLKEVKTWLIGEHGENMSVLKEELIPATGTGNYVAKINLLFDGYIMNEFIGPVTESSFHNEVWNKYMNALVSEGVCYANGKVPEALETNLRKHVDELAQKMPVDFHPNSNDVVRDLVHPALYSYIKDVSKFKKNCKPPPTECNSEEGDFWGRKYEDSKFQWLPSPFKITQNGECLIQDCINNLDRNQFPELYKDLECLFEVFLPYFEEVWSYAKAMDFFENSDTDYPEVDTIPPLKKESKSFKGQELQVITKIVQYTLQPGQAYEGVWHAEGMSHENIVMTGIYFLDRNADINGGDLRFKRAFTNPERSKIFWNINQSRPLVVNKFAEEGFIPLGYFPTQQGYILVFPNCHIHKIAKMINASESNEASRRIVVFFFVNPEKKIISTTDVLPLKNYISLAAAKNYRLELMAERKYDKEKLNVRDIELCEH